MRRTARQVIRSLEMRVAHLEREAGIFDMFYSDKKWAIECFKNLEKSGVLGRGAKFTKVIQQPGIAKQKNDGLGSRTFVFTARIQDPKSRFTHSLRDDVYDMIFVSDATFVEGSTDFLKASFILRRNGREIAYAKHGEMSPRFLGEVRKDLAKNPPRFDLG